MYRSKSMIERIPSFVPDLDEILGGGLPAHSTILLSGVPGSGKTILASQIAYGNANPENKALFVSTVSEPQARNLQFIQGFSFFDLQKAGSSVIYEDLGPQLLEGNGVAALAQLEELVLQINPAVVVVDSYRALRELSNSAQESRRSLYRLVAILTALPCTTILVGEYQPAEITTAIEATIVDGILVMDNRLMGLRDYRTLRVYKLRGSHYISGLHSLRITSDGITVFPRFTTPAETQSYAVSRERAKTGIAGFDSEILPGGILRGTTSLVVGDPGVGKTVTALHFLLNGIRQGEAGAYISFQENPSQLARIAENFGFDVPAMDQSKLAMFYTSPVELNIDEHARKMVALLEKINARRVVIDSINDLEAGARQDSDRFFNFVYSLVQWFKQRNITAILTAEMGELFSNQLTLTGRGVSHIADNIFLLRYTEIGGEVRKAFVVLSARGSEHSKQVREYLISEKEGPRIGPPLSHAFSGFTSTIRGKK